MSELQKRLFARESLYNWLRDNTNRVGRMVDDISESEFCNSTDDQILEHVYNSLEVLPIELDEGSQKMSYKEIKIDVSKDPRRDVRDRSQKLLIRGLRVTVSTPFTGDSSLFYYRPTRFCRDPLRANIQQRAPEDVGTIEVIVEHPQEPNGNPNVYRDEANGILSQIKAYLSDVHSQVHSHNHGLKETIRRSVACRRQRLDRFAEIVKTMNIPLKRNSNAPEITKLRIKRRIIRPLANKPQTREEYGIADEVYEHILQVIRHEGRSFESIPKTLSVHGEEELRDFIVAHLNTHYEGDATGETFRVHGKTDIRIEFENRAAFVGECKVWSGPKALSKAVDQLLSYVTWRDSKGAIIILNKDMSGFTAIQEKVLPALKKHSKYVIEESTEHASEWRVRFLSADDDDHEVTIHVFLFNLYMTQERKSGGK